MEGIVEKIGVFGVVLLALAVLIGVSFGVFSIAKNTANDGVVGVQDALGAMNESVYADYDQKTLSGTQVVSAYNTMNGKPVAIIVKTCKGAWVNYNALISPYTSGTGVSTTTIPFAGLTKDASSKLITSTVSYFDKVAAGTEVNLVMSNDPDLSKRVVLYNGVITEMLKIGSTNYVTSTAKFNSYLVKDPGDTIVGIVFVQQGKHVV